MRHVLDEVRELGIEVRFLDLKKNGYSIVDLDVIFINQNLNEDKMKEVLIHELAHFKLHSDYMIMYKMHGPRLKMEQEAISHVLKRIIDENDGVYNYTQLIDSFRIQMGNDVKYCK